MRTLTVQPENRLLYTTLKVRIFCVYLKGIDPIITHNLSQKLQKQKTKKKCRKTIPRYEINVSQNIKGLQVLEPPYWGAQRGGW